MQPENPLYPRPSKLDKLASEALRERERREIELVTLQQLDELFDGDSAIHDTLSEAHPIFGRLSRLRDVRSSSDILSSKSNIKKFFDSKGMPSFDSQRFFTPRVSYMRPHEHVVDTRRGVEFASSVVRVQYGASEQIKIYLQEQGRSTAPVSVYGIRVGARAKYEGMPDINTPDVRFDPDEMRAFVMVGQNGEACVTVRDDSSDAAKHRSASNAERELVFNELQLAVDSLGKEESA